MPLNSSIFSKMVGKVVQSLRENAVAPRLISSDYKLALAKQGDTLTVPFPGPVPARDVVPAAVPPATANPVNNSVSVTLDIWKEAAFTITDRDLTGLADPKSYISQQLEESGRTIANVVDSAVLGLYVHTPFTAGTAGTTPFASSTAVLQTAETLLIQNVAPAGKRSLILDPFAYGNALGLSVFQNNQSFGSELIKEGRIARALGYDWSYDQNVQTHTRGALGGTPLIVGVQAIGTTSVATDGWTASVAGILKRGDIVTFAGDTNPYVVTADCNSTAGGLVSIPIANGYVERANTGLLVATVDNAAVTVIASHKSSLAIHPNFAFIVSRIPDMLTIEDAAKVSYRVPWIDPVSGTTMLVKVSEQHWQTEFSVSVLFGVKPLWTQFGVRILG